MEWIRQRLDKIKEPFAPGKKYEKYAPAVNAIDTFLFTPNHTTQKGAHIRDAVDLKRTMITVVLALIPALIFGMWNAGYQHFSQLGEAFTMWEAIGHGALKIVPMIVVSYAVGLGIEFAFAIFRGHEVNEGYLVTGLLIPMIMPIDLPLWMLALSVVFAVLVGKEAFGGTGMNILNPALTARAFAFFAYPTYMSGNQVWVSEASNVDAISGETILGSLAAGDNVSYGMMDMFYGVIPGSVAETSTLLVLVGALLLILTKVGSWRIILSAFIGAAAMALIFNALPAMGVAGNDLTNFPWYGHLIIGGLAFGIVFMATDPVSAAQTLKGKWIYGFLIGFLSVMIRVFNPAYPEGVMLAILLMNVFAPTIDHYVIQSNIKRRKKKNSIRHRTGENNSLVMEEKSVNKTNSNGYTFLFAVIMVIVVASVLAFTATSLQPIQRENVRQEKMQSILATIGVETDRAGAEELYNRYITEAITLDNNGEEREGVDAFTVDLAKEIKKEDEEQNFPLYIADYEGEKYYIVPLRGNGLWNAIFGYISLEDDINTIKGATFDHLGETPGLGAEITKEWFKESFAEEKDFDGSGNLVGVSVVKGDIDPSDKEDNQVDAISGATITGDGVSDMISERLQRYLPYFKKQTDIKVATK